MARRAISTAALLVAVLGGACGGGGATNVAAEKAGAATPAGSAVIESTTTIATTTTVPAVVAPVEPASAPTVTVAPKPDPATVEVDYQPAEGATATATISGPNGSHTKSLASGAAIFGNLPAGTYSITVTIDTPSDDPTVGDARQILNGNSIDVGAGDHATITCDDSTGCSGVLGG